MFVVLFSKPGKLGRPSQAHGGDGKNSKHWQQKLRQPIKATGKTKAHASRPRRWEESFAQRDGGLVIS